MKTHDFYYDLPENLIAQTPITPRDASRMLVCNRENTLRKHDVFQHISDYLRPGDVMVINQTKVIPARLLGEKTDTKVPVEVLLLKRLEQDKWETLVKPGRRLREGAKVSFGNGALTCVIGETTSSGGRIVQFQYTGVFEAILDELGEMPLPPYIHEKLQDASRYQTVYAKMEGSAAAPTAGLHFTPQVMQTIVGKGVDIVPILLHVGLGTFRPVKAQNVEDHLMHEEYYEVSQEAADRINQGRRNGGRVLCVGTTSVRTLETVTTQEGTVMPGSGSTNIFIKPGTCFHAADMMLTNFHLPESTLLMLVSAFMGRENALEAYQDAVREKYRFFSFGDCMLIGGNLLTS